MTNNAAPLRRTLREIAADITFDAEMRGLDLPKGTAGTLCVLEYTDSTELGGSWGGRHVGLYVAQFVRAMSEQEWDSPVITKCLDELRGAVTNFHQGMVFAAEH